MNDSTHTDTPQGRSALDMVRGRRQRLEEKKVLTLAVPGYDEPVDPGDPSKGTFKCLFVRYDTIAPSEIDAFTAQLNIEDETSIKASELFSDLLIRCCSGILVRPSHGAELEPLDPSGIAATFSSGTLPELLGLTVKDESVEGGERAPVSARENVWSFFSPEDVQPMASATHATAVLNWLSNSSVEIDRELLGE